MKIPENLWKSMKVHAEIHACRKFMNIHDDSWKFVEIRKIPWKFMKIRGNLWKFMKMRRNAWKSMTIHA